MDLGDSRVRVLVDGQISWFEEAPVRWLGFPPELESWFELKTAALRSRRIFAEGIFCVVLFNLFALSDFFLFHRSFLHSVFIRLGIATPFAVAALIGLRQGHSKWIRETSILVVAFVFSTSILCLYSDISSVVSAYALVDVMLIILFANVGIQIRFSYGLAIATICASLGVVFVRLDRWLNGPEKIESVAVLLAGSCLSLIANYSIEYRERMTFLLRMRSGIQAQELIGANRHLLEIANEDKLTRISNRRHFEEVYKSIWAEGSANQTAVSVIMIDVDHFKNTNDRFGHGHGDATLSRIAALLRDDLRNRGDFVARYGGEEFAVVLADSSEEIGRCVAERLRALVEARSGLAESLDGLLAPVSSTISCGVATSWPEPGSHSKILVTLADDLLYRAKAQGRNRVCHAGSPA
jgi:diguanylate cyclase (GGDEF)-like protein